MNRIPEFEIMQNTTLGALAIHTFVKEYYSSKNKVIGVQLPYIMPVLPIVYNEDSSREISSKQLRTTSFYKALSEEKFIPIGLQNRMEEMYSQTMSSINVGLSLGIILYSKEDNCFYPKDKIRLPEIYADDNLNIIKAAKNLGCWFARIDVDDLCIALKINF
jgi:hypothetical protein